MYIRHIRQICNHGTGKALCVLEQTWEDHGYEQARLIRELNYPVNTQWCTHTHTHTHTNKRTLASSWIDPQAHSHSKLFNVLLQHSRRLDLHGDKARACRLCIHIFRIDFVCFDYCYCLYRPHCWPVAVPHGKTPWLRQLHAHNLLYRCPCYHFGMVSPIK